MEPDEQRAGVLFHDSMLGTLSPPHACHNLVLCGLVAHMMDNEQHFVRIARGGMIVVDTGEHTGRAANDKFFECAAGSAVEQNIDWRSNRPISPEEFAFLTRHHIAAMNTREHLFVTDAWAGADPAYRMPLRIITETASHAHFARMMFLRAPALEQHESMFRAPFTILHAPSVFAPLSSEYPPEMGGKSVLNSGTYILISINRRLIVIGGTAYAGEIKKAVFTVLNYLLPDLDVLPMHCSATVGEGGDTTVIFGLSGTGKTTLSADSHRKLIGDDEHGWGPSGVYNFEGGCYAKLIGVTKESEPEIYKAATKHYALLENVAMDPETGEVDFSDSTKTENTRGTYSLDFLNDPDGHLENVVFCGCGGHAKNVVMLTCDAFGVLPPISRLSPAQAAYHFLSGYTAKVAGTEMGVTEPSAVFSPCFGGPFMPRNPAVYADILRRRIEEWGASCWLINTGWVGPLPSSPEERKKCRIPLSRTRMLLDMALSGMFDDVPYFENYGALRLSVPYCIPREYADRICARDLFPENAWIGARRTLEEFQAESGKLAVRFRLNFEHHYNSASSDVRLYADSIGS